MNAWVDTIMLLLILTNLALLGSGQLRFCIRVVAVQGIALGLLPIVLGSYGWSIHAIIVAVSALTLKGIVFPWLLLAALRAADVRRETDPFVGYNFSLIAGVIALAVSLWAGPHFVLPTPADSNLMLPVAFFTIIVGFFLIVTRKMALTQVLGYLVLENGIYTFGATISAEQPWLVEMGILLDVFVAVFIMGIMIFHISREFDHIDTHKLTCLSDWKQNEEDEADSEIILSQRRSDP